MKQVYWKCVDCQSIINDDNMKCFESSFLRDETRWVEFCFGCNSYQPEVILAYD